MEKVKLAVLLIVPIVLLTMASVLIVFDQHHQESLSQTQEAIHALGKKASTLPSEAEKDKYIEYLSKSIIDIRQDSEAYAEDVFSFYRPTIYCLISLAILQLIVLVQAHILRSKK